jgi:spore germination protein KB
METISTRQAAILSSMYYVGSAILVVPSTLTTLADRDAWLSALLAAAAALAVMPLFSFIVRRAGGRTLPQLLERLCGRWPGKIITAAYVVLFPYLTFAMTLRNLGDFLSVTMLKNTPLAMLHIVFVLVIVFGVYWGIEALGRAAELFVPMLSFMAVVLLIGLAPELHAVNLLPVLEKGMKPVLHGTIPLWAFPYMETFLLLFLDHHLQPDERGKPPSYLYVATAASGVVFFLMTLVSLLVLGSKLTAVVAYPSFFVASIISVGHLFERLESLMAIIWLITIYFRLSLLLHLSASALSQTLAMSRSRVLVAPLALLALPFSLVVWPSTTYLTEFTFIWPYCAFLLGIVLPLILAAALRFRPAAASNK